MWCFISLLIITLSFCTYLPYFLKWTFFCYFYFIIIIIISIIETLFYPFCYLYCFLGKKFHFETRNKTNFYLFESEWLTVYWIFFNNCQHTASFNKKWWIRWSGCEWDTMIHEVRVVICARMVPSSIVIQNIGRDMKLFHDFSLIN